MTVVLALFLTLPTAVDTTQDWPQWLGPQRDGVWRETGILEKFPPGGPKLLWTTPIHGGYAGPAVANGRVYVTDMKYDEGVQKDPNDFNRKRLTGKETIYCLDARSGEVVWKHSYTCEYTISYAYGPRCTPVVHDGRVYSLGAMGDLLCLSADKGEVLWSRNFVKEFKIAPPLWATP